MSNTPEPPSTGVSTQKLTPQQIYNYVDNYYKNILTRLQSNYGKVYIRTTAQSIVPEFNNTNDVIQNQIEKQRRELLSEIGFDGFNSTLHAKDTTLNAQTPIEQVEAVFQHNCTTVPGNVEADFMSVPPHDTLAHGTPLHPENYPLHAKNFTEDILEQAANNTTINGGVANPYVGKSLYLGRDVEAGDVIFSERPISALNLYTAYCQTCDYCLRPVGNIEEQIWTMLMAGPKTVASTGPKDILALLNKIADFKDVIKEYAYLSFFDSDEEDEENDNENGNNATSAATADSKLTTEQKAEIKKALNKTLLKNKSKQNVLKFYQDVVLKQYNYVLKSLHEQEKAMLISKGKDSAVENNDGEVIDVEKTSTDDQQQYQYTVEDIMRDTYDLLESLPLNAVLDINELDNPETHIFEPSQGKVEVTPVFSPYNDSVYCSIRCLCMAYNNYDHILTHAYPEISLDQVEGDVSLLGDEFQLKEVTQDSDGDSDGGEDDNEGHHDHTNNNNTTSTTTSTTTTNGDDKKKSDKTPKAQHSLHKTLPPPDQIKGVLTTSTTQPIGPSGLPFLHQSQLYYDLKFFSKSTNEMFLAHVRKITHSLSYWGTSLIRTLGGDYNDIISLLMLNGQFISINNSPIYTNNVGIDFNALTNVNNYYIDQQLPQAEQDQQAADVIENKNLIEQQFAQVKTNLIQKFDSNIDKVIQKHEKFIHTRLSNEDNNNNNNNNPESNKDDNDDNNKNPFDEFNQDAFIQDNQQDDLKAFPNTTIANTTIKQPYINNTKKLSQQCYCSKCLNELSYNLLQYSLFPYLLFTQTQWWCHIHDEDNQDFYQVTAAANKAGAAKGKHDGPTLFQSQIELLQAVEVIFEPMVMSYMKAIAVYCSFITKLYPKCLKQQVQDHQITTTTTTPAPYFTDILYKTSHIDPDRVMYIPYSEQNVRETMNNLIFRIQQYSDNIQRPLDTTHWMFISHFISIGEMNNIQIQPRTACQDVAEFFTIHNLKDLDPEDVPQAEEDMELMYQAARNVYQRQNKNTIQTNDDYPEYLKNKDSYIDFVLKTTKELNKAPVKKTTAKQTTTSAATDPTMGDVGKAWSLLNKRAERYPDCAALYRIACTMNHSCAPNVLIVPYYSGRNYLIAGLAARDIKKDEELYISYIQYDELTYKERQMKLKDYQFVCQCPRCSADKKKILAAQKAKQAAAAGAGAKKTTTSATAASRPSNTKTIGATGGAKKPTGGTKK